MFQPSTLQIFKCKPIKILTLHKLIILSLVVAVISGAGGTCVQCTVGQSPKGMMVFIYIGHYQGCRVLKCVQGCCRVCPGVLQNVCRDTECVQGAVLTSSLAQQD